MKKSMKLTSKIVLIPLVLLLTSCGYALREVYDGDAYNSPLYEANFYYGKADVFNPESPNYKVTEVTYTDLDKDANLVFACRDSQLKSDTNFNVIRTACGEKEYESIFDYSDTNYLSNIEGSFKYGYASKLFDNWPECGGRYEKARIQIDNNQRNGGFNTLFQKECDNSSYFAFIFQNGVGKRQASGDERFKDIVVCNCTIDLNIGFYIRTDDGKGDVSYRLDNYKYRISGFRNNASDYCFFGFAFGNNVDITRCQGVDISYDLISIKDGYSIDYTAAYNNDEIGHCIYAYEMWLPHSSWN